MSYQYVTGYSYPMFKIYSGTTLIESINLDYCGAEGLFETYELLGYEHNFTDYSTSQAIQGVHYYFDLSYSEYSDMTNSLKIKRIVNYAIDGNKIYIYPRADILNRFYEVILIRDNITLGILKGGILAAGNKGIKIKFRTKNKLPYLDWLNVNDLTVVNDYLIII